LSESGVPSFEMSGSMGPDDGFERLLRGETPKTPEEQALGLFFQDVRGAFQAEPSLEEEAHIAAIVQAAQLLADKGEPAVRSASKADGRARHASGLPKRRRVIMKVPLMRSLAAKVVAGLVVLMSMFGGLALAGALPGQGSGEDESGVVQIQDVETDEPVETEAPETADADDQGENEDADDQGENEDADDQGENEDADDQANDDQGENEDADDQGEDVNDDQGDDDQGENEDADDQGDDDQGEQD
jgi:hypothetical protein